METVNCNLCGSSNYRLVYSCQDAHYPSGELFHMVECVDCGLGFINPRPTTTEIQKYYRREYYEKRKSDAESLIRRYERQSKYVPTPATSKPALLDVGCAAGGFLHHMRNNGWDVVGVEVGDNASPAVDLTIHRVPLTEAPIEPESFDVVTMWAVLEHLHDPMSYLVASHKALKREGFLVFHTHNFGSLAHKRLFREDIPRHLYCFTKDNIRTYLRESGFRLVEAYTRRELFNSDPHNWLFYLRHKLLRRGPFRVEHAKKPRVAYFKEKGLGPGVRSTLSYALHEPFAAIDTALTPLVGYLECVFRVYGEVTYVAQKG